MESVAATSVLRPAQLSLQHSSSAAGKQMQVGRAHFNSACIGTPFGHWPSVKTEKAAKRRLVGRARCSLRTKASVLIERL
jgi:hypothetical protein